MVGTAHGHSKTRSRDLGTKCKQNWAAIDVDMPVNGGCECGDSAKYCAEVDMLVTDLSEKLGEGKYSAEAELRSSLFGAAMYGSCIEMQGEANTVAVDRIASSLSMAAKRIFMLCRGKI